MNPGRGVGHGSQLSVPRVRHAEAGESVSPVLPDRDVDGDRYKGSPRRILGALRPLARGARLVGRMICCLQRRVPLLCPHSDGWLPSDRDVIPARGLGAPRHEQCHP